MLGLRGQKFEISGEKNASGSGKLSGRPANSKRFTKKPFICLSKINPFHE